MPTPRPGPTPPHSHTQPEGQRYATPSSLGALELLVVDRLLDICGLHAVDRATNRPARAKYLLHRARERLGQTLATHLPGDVEESILCDVAAMLDVLGLLAVTHGLLQLLDEKARGVRLHIDLRSTVLDGEPHCHTDAFPGASALHDVVSHLLWRHAQGPHLGCEHGGRGLPPAVLAQLHNLDLVGIELGRHCCHKSVAGLRRKLS